MATSHYDIKVSTSDDPTGVKNATKEALLYSDALGQVAKQMDKASERRAAREQYKLLTDEQKAQVRATYDSKQAFIESNKQMQNNAGIIANLKTKWTELNSQIQIAQQVVQTLGQISDATVGKYVDLADRVRDLSAASGMSAEQASRMLQMADDAFVSMDQLQKAMETLARKGISPTIDNVAELSKQYLALAPGTERATFLAEKFGKANMDLYKILEMGPEKIKQNANAVNDALVLDDAKLQAVEDYKTALDNLGDAANAAGVSIGSVLVPHLTNAANAIVTIMTANQQYKAVLIDHEADVLKTSVSYREYVKEMERAAKAAGLLIDANGNLTTWSGALLQKNLTMTESQYLLARSSEVAAAKIDQERRAINGLPQKTNLEINTKFTYTDTQSAYMTRFLETHPGYFPNQTSYMSNFMDTHPNYLPGVSTRARGGPVKAGQPYWVGEEGPEPFIPETDGYIMSHADSQKRNAVVGGGSGIIVQIAYSPFIDLADKRTAAYDLANLLETELARKGYVRR